MSPYGDVVLAKSLNYSVYIYGSASFFASIQFSSGSIPGLPAEHTPSLQDEELVPAQYLC